MHLMDEAVSLLHISLAKWHAQQSFGFNFDTLFASTFLNSSLSSLKAPQNSSYITFRALVCAAPFSTRTCVTSSITLSSCSWAFFTATTLRPTVCTAVAPTHLWAIKTEVGENHVWQALHSRLTSFVFMFDKLCAISMRRWCYRYTLRSCITWERYWAYRLVPNVYRNIKLNL